MLPGTPEFSVIMPLYNKAKWVRASVISVLAQRDASFELLVVDDGSTDGSSDQIADLKDVRMRVLHQTNAGVSAARNRGISDALGTIVCFLDADDLWQHNHLTVLRRLIDHQPEARAWAVSYTEFDGTLAVGDAAPPVTTAQPPIQLLDTADFFLAWARQPFFYTCAIAARKTTLATLQPCFPEGESHGEDQDLWFRLCESGVLAFQNVRHTVYYRRGVTESLTSMAQLSPLPCMLRLRERMDAMPTRTGNAARRLVELHLLHVAWANLLAGCRCASWRYLALVQLQVRPAYWARIAAASLLPTSTLRWLQTRWRAT